MNTIQESYVTAPKGNRTAVLIDLQACQAMLVNLAIMQIEQLHEAQA